jgi:CRP-like cAMP-binding protein
VTAADRHEALRAASLFRDFTEVGLRILSEMSASRKVGRGAYAFRAGEPSRELAVLVRGSLQLVGRDGGPPLGEVMPGDTLGGLTLLAESEHLVSALASTEVELVQLSRDAFEELQRTRPGAAPGIPRLADQQTPDGASLRRSAVGKVESISARP